MTKIAPSTKTSRRSSRTTPHTNETAAMQYMILIYGDEQSWSKMSEADRSTSFAAFMQYNQELATSGALRSGQQLQPSRAAKHLKMVNGKVASTDGPFVEVKEQLGGFYIVEVATEEEVVALAGKCPAIHGGVIEIRPLLPQNF